MAWKLMAEADSLTLALRCMICTAFPHPSQNNIQATTVCFVCAKLAQVQVGLP